MFMDKDFIHVVYIYIKKQRKKKKIHALTSKKEKKDYFLRQEIYWALRV